MVTPHETDPAKLAFLENIDHEIKQIDSEITQTFIDEFTEAGEEVNFTSWQDRFKVAGVNVDAIKESVACWTITFEDTQAPYAHFNLHIEGREITGMSIDT